MAALALHMDAEIVHRRQHRAGSDGELADGKARRIVHAIDLLDAEALHHAVEHHGLAALLALFRRLEDDRDRAVEIAGLGEILGGAQQHGGVAVMAAGVHLARHLGGMG